MEKLNSLKFWVSPRLIPATENVIARSKRDRHSFHNDSFLNSLIEVQIIQQGQKRNTGRTHLTLQCCRSDSLPSLALKSSARCSRNNWVLSTLCRKRKIYCRLDIEVRLIRSTCSIVN